MSSIVSPPPYANSFVIGIAVINTHTAYIYRHQPPWSFGFDSKREEPGKTGRHPVLKYRVPDRSLREQLYNRYCSNKQTQHTGTAVINTHTYSFITGTAVINTD
jgi:hypothetical protein